MDGGVATAPVMELTRLERRIREAEDARRAKEDQLRIVREEQRRQRELRRLQEEEEEKLYAQRREARLRKLSQMRIDGVDDPNVQLTAAALGSAPSPGAAADSADIVTTAVITSLSETDNTVSASTAPSTLHSTPFSDPEIPMGGSRYASASEVVASASTMEGLPEELREAETAVEMLAAVIASVDKHNNEGNTEKMHDLWGGACTQPSGATPFGIPSTDARVEPSISHQVGTMPEELPESVHPDNGSVVAHATAKAETIPHSISFPIAITSTSKGGDGDARATEDFNAQPHSLRKSHRPHHAARLARKPANSDGEDAEETFEAVEEQVKRAKGLYDGLRYEEAMRDGTRNLVRALRQSRSPILESAEKEFAEREARTFQTRSELRRACSTLPPALLEIAGISTSAVFATGDLRGQHATTNSPFSLAVAHSTAAFPQGTPPSYATLRRTPLAKMSPLTPNGSLIGGGSGARTGRRSMSPNHANIMAELSNLTLGENGEVVLDPRSNRPGASVKSPYLPSTAEILLSGVKLQLCKDRPRDSKGPERYLHSYFFVARCGTQVFTSNITEIHGADKEIIFDEQVSFAGVPHSFEAMVDVYYKRRKDP
eukprot:Opistho-2@12781